MPYRLYLLCVLASLGLSGCVGLSIVVGTRQQPLGATLGRSAGERGTATGGVTTADALRLWGEPRRKEVVGGQQRWRYRTDKLAWRGAQVWFIVPIPLLLPVGHKRVTLTFEGERLHSYAIDNARERYFGYFHSSYDSRTWRFNEDNGRGENDTDCNGYYGCY